MTRGHRFDDSPLDCLIVGAGPAGMTAALYLGRFHRRIRIIDAGATRALWITKAHNVPGHVDGISGADMLKRLREQLAQQDLQVEPGELFGLSREAEHFQTRVRGSVPNSRVSARRLLLTTGEMLDGDSNHERDIIYSACGSTPRATPATKIGALTDDKGALQVDAHGLTSVPGLYAAGDVVSALDQIAVAMGHGATTATAIHDSL